VVTIFVRIRRAPKGAVLGDGRCTSARETAELREFRDSRMREGRTFHVDIGDVAWRRVP